MVGNEMKLNELVKKLNEFDEEKTIYAKRPWHPDTLVIIATELEAGVVPEEAIKIGAEYFLEIFLANEFLEGCISYSKNLLSFQEKCLRLIEYAENDA